MDCNPDSSILSMGPVLNRNRYLVFKKVSIFEKHHLFPAGFIFQHIYYDEKVLCYFDNIWLILC